MAKTSRQKHQSKKLASVLHDQRKSSEDATENDSQTVTASEIQSSLSTALGGRRRGSWSSGSGRIPTETSVHNASIPTCSTCWNSGCSGGRCGRNVNSSRVLGTTRMLTSAVGLAGGITAAVGHTLCAIFCADEVRKSLGELGGIGALAVSADAIVGEVSCVTVIGICCRRFSWQLQAEQWASVNLTLAPRISCGYRNTGWVDVIDCLRVDFQGQQDDSQSSHRSLEGEHRVGY